MSSKQKENISIPIIDNEEIKEYLFPSNYQIIIEYSYKKVLDLLKSMAFSVVLIDIKFKINTKIDINNITEDNQQNCDIILLTEYFHIDKTLVSLPKICQEFLVKPFSSDTFKLIIERVLKKQLLRQKVDFTELPKLIQDTKVTIKSNHFVYKALEKMNLDYIKSVLSYTKGNKTHAAKILEIDRKTLW